MKSRRADGYARSYIELNSGTRDEEKARHPWEGGGFELLRYDAQSGQEARVDDKPTLAGPIS